MPPPVVPAAVCAGLLALASPVAAVGAAAEAVSPSPDRGAAPTVAPGLHLVDLQEDGWIRIDRADPTSTLWVGESVTVADVNSAEHVLALADADGDCAWAGSDAVGDELVQVRFRTGGIVSDGCSGDSVWLQHDLYSASNYAGSPTTLAVWEEPPAQRVKELPAPSREVNWSAGSGADAIIRDLGVSFRAAPELTDGRYDVRVAPGEPALFAVDLDWGQHLQLEMSVTSDNVFSAPLVRPRLINPVGMTAAWAEPTVSPSGTQPPADDYLLLIPQLAKRAGVVSPTVRWRNREAPANAAAFPGRYYVALDMEADGEDADSAGAEFTIDVVVGTEEKAASPYAEEPQPLPDLTTDLTPEESSEEPDPASTEPSGGSDGAAADDEKPWPAALGLFAGSLVCAVAGSLLLGRWRRGVAR